MNEHDIFLKLHNTYEKKALRILLKEFKRISRNLPIELLTPTNAETILNLAVNESELEKTLFKVHLTIGQSYGNLEARRYRKIIREQKKWKPLALFNTKFQDFLLKYYKKFGGEQIKLLSETYIETIVSAIKEATIENETVIQMRDRIYKAVNKPDFYRWQALRIARTETTFAMNSAKQISGEVSGVTMEKVWVTAVDGRERDAHRVANDKAVEQNAFFIVGGEKMLYPGDRANGASVRNLVNCRCSFGYRAKRDSEGNIIYNDL